MADALNNIIDLNIAIQEDNLEKAKTLVAELNTQLDDLRERFEIPDNQDICNYFSFQLVFENNHNNTRNYVIDNFLGLDEELRKIYQWFREIDGLIDTPTLESSNALLNKVFSQDKIEDYKISAIIRLINYTQRYDLFTSLKEKSAK